MRKFLLFILIAVPTLRVFSQENARLLAQVPFETFLSGIVIVKAQLVPYKDSLNFILDTGSSGISLDSTTSMRLGVESRLTDTFAAGVGGRKKVRFAFGRTLMIGGCKAENLSFHLNDYSLLTALYNIKIDGIIGYSFLKRYIVAIDYDESNVKIYSKGAFVYPAKGFTFRNPVTFIPFENATVTDARSVQGNLYFDSGAGLDLLLSRRFVADSNLLLPKRKPVVASVEGVMGREDMSATVIKQFSFGPYKFKYVPVFIFDDRNDVLKYPKGLGLIGSSILSRFNLVLNFPENEIFIKPNKSFNEPFDYSYSGLNIWENNGRIEVYDVIPASPAEKATFRIGDEIIGIERVFSGNLQDYRKMLKLRNTSLNVLVKRGTEYKMLLLKVGSIL